jgi:putative ABC transport system permease protein
VVIRRFEILNLQSTIRNRKMPIPLKYNLRSLFVRRAGTAMAVTSVAATVAVFVAVLALSQGIERVFALTGHPLNIVVIRQGSQVEGSSSLPIPIVQDLRYLPGIAPDSRGAPLVSPELLVLAFLARADGSTAANISLRGTSATGLLLRDQVRLVAGRMFRPGLRELIASRTVAGRLGLSLGSRARIGVNDWEVVGLTEASGSAYASELWGDVGAVANAFTRTQMYSSVLLRALDDAAAGELVRRISGDRRLHLQARLESDYFREQMRSSMPVKGLGMFLAVMMGVGSCFAAMNAMYATVAYRSREIATLRVVGFSRGAVLLGFLLESALLAGVGGLLGCLLALPVHGISTGTLNLLTFSEITFAFRITPRLLLEGLVFSLVVGVFGGLLPARLAAWRPLVSGLRS